MNPHPQDQDEEEEQDQLDSSDDEIGEFKDTQKPKRSKTTHSKANGNGKYRACQVSFPVLVTESICFQIFVSQSLLLEVARVALP